MTTLQLWLDPDQYAALAVRLEAEHRAAKALDESVLAGWALEDAADLQIAA
jgi:hypothetical protein